VFIPRLSVFFQLFVCSCLFIFCPCFFKSAFVRVYSKVCLSVFDRPTFVLVLPHICPPLTKRTSVRILSSEVRFTKQVCPYLGQTERRQQFAQNTPKFGSQHVTLCAHSVRPDSMRSEGAGRNHQLTQPYLRLTSCQQNRTEFRVNIRNVFCSGIRAQFFQNEFPYPLYSEIISTQSYLVLL
jgi:hypothetical protein